MRCVSHRSLGLVLKECALPSPAIDGGRQDDSQPNLSVREVSGSTPPSELRRNSYPNPSHRKVNTTPTEPHRHRPPASAPLLPQACHRVPDNSHDKRASE